MAESVLLTTHDLPLAGKLRTGFQRAGYRVELLAKGEDPSHVKDAVLLVVTGGLDAPAKSAPTESASANSAPAKSASYAVRQGRKMGVPIFVVGSRPGTPAPKSASAAFPSPADPDEIVLVGRRTVERKRLRSSTGIVGETDAMVEVMERVVQIAPVDATVLVTGESGTGKELVARGLHALSKRRHQAFIPVNMAALSETLLESELFGHEKGAFTGAVDMRKGIFELADGGTVFLDEIGEMPIQTQTKLLRVLEQQEFLRVGGQKPIRVDVRILAATNQRLPERVATGDFRKDLYYRLNVLHIALPPLRDRREDIPLLVNAFVADAIQRHDRGFFQGLTDKAMRILVRHRWPGNVRELRNLVESMVVLAPGRQIRAEDIPADVRAGDRSTSLVQAPMPTGAGVPAAPGSLEMRPQLEFIFRTMMDLKVDIDDLRREFEAFRRTKEDAPRFPTGEIVYDRRDTGHPEEAPPATTDDPLELLDEDLLEPPDDDPLESLDDDLLEPPDDNPVEPADYAVEDDSPTDAMPIDSPPPVSALPPAEAARESPNAVLYEPGMTLDEIEREVVRAALRDVDGNRRLAAESLGIGERTLYRKLARLGIDDS